MLNEFIAVSVTLFIIMNPLSSIPPFLVLTKNLDEKHKRAIADQAGLVAGGLAVAFLLLGQPFLGALGVSIQAFKVAGGVVIGLLGLQTVLGFKFNSKEEDNDAHSVGLLIGTPMLTGPGVLTSVLIQSSESGLLLTLGAIGVASLFSWLLLRYSAVLEKVFGVRIISVFAKVMGLMLVAKGSQWIVIGLKAIA